MNFESFYKNWPIFALLFGVGLFCFLLGFLLYSSFSSPSKPQAVVVEFADGQNKITVNPDGLVTIDTPYGTFTRQWDKETVRKFFANVNNMNLENLSEVLGGSTVILLTMSNGNKVSVLIEEAPLEITDTLTAEITDVYNTDLTADTQLSLKKITPFILPTPVFASATPIPTPISRGQNKPTEIKNPWQMGKDTTDLQSFDCADVNKNSGRKVVISNTVCAK